MGRKDGAVRRDGGGGRENAGEREGAGENVCWAETRDRKEPLREVGATEVEADE